MNTTYFTVYTIKFLFTNRGKLVPIFKCKTYTQISKTLFLLLTNNIDTKTLI